MSYVFYILFFRTCLSSVYSGMFVSVLLSVFSVVLANKLVYISGKYNDCCFKK